MARLQEDVGYDAETCRARPGHHIFQLHSAVQENGTRTVRLHLRREEHPGRDGLQLPHHDARRQVHANALHGRLSEQLSLQDVCR